jgi:hypothetical protein
MSAIHQVLLAGSGAGYQIQNSLRFRASNNGYLSRTAGASPTNDKIFTWSGWVKLGRSATTNLDYGVLFTGYTGNSDSGYGALRIRNSELYLGGWSTSWKGSTALFRDPSAWYHIVMAIDTTQATASNRIKLYVNGSQLTAFGSFNNDPSQNSTMGFNNASAVQRIGLDAPASSSYNFDGYMANVYFIDGQALTPSSFGQTDAATGVWVPKAYSGTYGTNGFFLQFKDATSTTTIGYDTSGNSNNWTTSGISVTAGATFDQMLDTPTNNYCTLNPLDVGTTNMALSNGNLDFTKSGTNFGPARGTLAVTTGKWYFEMLSNNTNLRQVGVSNDFNIRASSGDTSVSSTGGIGAAWDSRGYLYQTGAAPSYSFTYTTNDIVMVAFDASSGKIWFGKNGTWNSGDPAAGTSPAFTASGYSYLTPFVNGEGGGSGTLNFGQRAFSYTPPSGFKALNTANLSVPTIKKPSTLMSVATYTGNGSTQSISSLAFQPDLVWIKSRSAATTTNIFDSQRGVQKGIQSTGPNAEYTDANTLTSFNSTGFSLGSDASSRGVNVNTATYAAWTWKESVGAGLDIVLYTGNGGGARNIAHGLGVSPKWMFVRGRDARVWAGWHTNLTSAAYYMDLGTAAAEAVDTTMFDSTAPDASNFRVGSYNNINAVNYVSYLWSEVAGFSRFGSYVGNASTDGPFVWCGFSPKWIVIKARSIATSWMIFNPTGTSPNEAILRVLTDSAIAETSNTYGIDYLSNGFKVRAPSGYSINNSGETYTFAAFAEAPFKYARAR